MKYILMFVTNDALWQGLPETDVQKAYANIGAWFERYGASGKVVGGHELQPQTTATTVRFKGDQAVVTDGPFMESKESIGGFAVVEVGDLDEAIAMAKTWPGLGNVEIRPLVDHSDGLPAVGTGG